MPLEQAAVTIVFRAFFVESKVGKAGLTVTVDVYDPAGTKVVDNAAATEIAGGLYSYSLSGATPTTEGEWVAVFKTATTTVDVQHIPAIWVVGRAGIENLDATVSTRAPEAGGNVAEILADVTGLDGAAMRGTDGANTTTPLSAAGVRAALGMTAADLDDQLDALPTAAENSAAILAATIAELTAVPGADPSLTQLLSLIYHGLREKVTVTGSVSTLHKSDGTALGTKALSDDGTTYTEARMS